MEPHLLDQHPVTLSDMLIAKDLRAACQQNLLAQYQLPLLSLTIITPGKIKLNDCILFIFNQAYQQIRSYCKQYRIPCMTHQQKILKTGPEGFFVLNQSELKLKRACIEIEQSTPLGRLWDLDVISAISGLPISRKTLGYEPRRCLICDNEAKVCGRSRVHSIAELMQTIEDIAVQAGYRPRDH